MRHDQSICKKCSNIPCRNGEHISPDSFYLVSAQFKIDFGMVNGSVFIKKCSGYNKKNYVYFPFNKGPK